MRPTDKRDRGGEVDWPIPATNRGGAESRFALSLFGLTVGLFAIAGGLAFLLTRTFLPPRPPTGTFLVPTAFAFSTLFLVIASAAMGRAQASVRRERQRSFRKALLWALAFGTAFVGVQAFGLWTIVENMRADRNAGEAQLGPSVLVLGAAGLHALHMTVGLMALAYVTLQGFANRYDHEYSFGVAFWAWFWHVFCIMWIFILGAYGIVSGFLTEFLPR